MASAAELALIIGIIGNVTSVLVYASPIPTFWYIYKKKSTEYFSALPYVCTLLTVLLGLYYGSIKQNGMLIITINAIGLIFEAAYLTIFLVYATKFSRAKTVKQLLLDAILFGAAVLFTMLFTHDKLRVIVVGSLCSAVAVSMYAAPLSIMRMVIRTKNVDFMPATLSAFLAINGSLWSAYSFFARDIFIGIPSVLGSLLAVVQVIVYFCYKNAKRPEGEDEKPQKQGEQPHHKIDVTDGSSQEQQEQQEQQQQQDSPGKQQVQQEQEQYNHNINKQPQHEQVEQELKPPQDHHKAQQQHIEMQEQHQQHQVHHQPHQQEQQQQHQHQQQQH